MKEREGGREGAEEKQDAEEGSLARIETLRLKARGSPDQEAGVRNPLTKLVRPVLILDLGKT